MGSDFSYLYEISKSHYYDLVKIDNISAISVDLVVLYIFQSEMKTRFYLINVDLRSLLFVHLWTIN